MKKLILLALAAIAICGCNFGGSKAKFDNFADVSKPFLGYMTVNSWMDKDPSAVMEKLVKKNIQAMPFEFFESPKAYADPNVQSRINKFEKYVKESQDRKMILYVTLLNCNLGNPKTGHPEITSPKCDKQIMAAANALAVWMKKYSNIYVTPCGEGGNMSPAYEKKVQEWCKANMPRSHLVNNWGSRPSGTDGMAFRCLHPAGIAAKVPRGAWNMSDHTTTINQLKAGGYPVVLNYAKSMYKNMVPFFYYDNKENAPLDDAAINALCDSQK